jgi:endonuclease YncB( thermonuclease family)
VEGLVIGISSGDYITVNSFGSEISVRLYGTAAPQLGKIDKFTGWSKPGQPYAEEAYRALSTKVLHQQVKVEIRNTVVFKKDDKQLALAVVYLDGRNINLEMISEGWAWAYRKFIEDLGEFHQYVRAERRARVKHLGLWVQDRPQPPWEFKPKLKVTPPRHAH